jgi:sucrose-6-phosphate hydrolase SacC (GH32 family)
VYDPVHGVIHHFYQIHLAADPGHGPDYGHFVSKDFVTWAAMPVAIWNGLDNSVDPWKVTPYDNEASGRFFGRWSSRGVLSGAVEYMCTGMYETTPQQHTNRCRLLARATFLHRSTHHYVF